MNGKAAAAPNPGGAVFDPSQPAVLPASVPELPIDYKETDTVKTLVPILLQVPSMPPSPRASCAATHHCRVPAAEPPPPLSYLALSPSLRLPQTKSSPDFKPRVGFYGMGGLGKTVTGAALVRSEAVRDAFDQVQRAPSFLDLPAPILCQRLMPLPVALLSSCQRLMPLPRGAAADHLDPSRAEPGDGQAAAQHVQPADRQRPPRRLHLLQ